MKDGKARRAAVLTSAKIDSAGGDPTARARRVSTNRVFAAGGDSIVAGGYAGSSLIYRTAWQSGGEFVLGSNVAVGGKRSDEILAAQFPTLLASSSQLLVVNGGTNDIAQAVGGSSTTGDIAARTNWATMLSQSRAAGKTLVSLGMLPSSNVYVSDMARHELWRMSWARKNGIPHAHVWHKLGQANGSYASGLNLDSLHPNSAGADIAAAEVLAQLRAPGKLAPFGELMDFAAGITVLLPNAVSFGGVAAAVPTGYSSVGSGGSYAIVAPSDGSLGNWFKTTISGAQTGCGWSGTARTLANLGWSTGDKVAVGFRLKTVATSEGSLQLTVSLQTSNLVLFNEYCPVTGDWWIYGETTLNSNTPLFKVTANTTGAGSQEFWIQRPLIYNLTANGLG
jgi:lysophospholipase L1-like esterase